MALPLGTVNRDTLIALKISYKDTVKKIRLPLSDLSSTVLPTKLRLHLSIPLREKVLFERYSDSAGGYIVLDKNTPPVYKALVRAAKAKGKLRLRATLIEKPAQEPQEEAPSAADVTTATTATAGTTTDVSRDFVPAQPRMIGPGIFEYRAAHHPQQPSTTDEAPVPQPFATPEMKETSSAVPHARKLALCTRGPKTSCLQAPQAAWSVYCNVCDVAMSDVHYHCSICDGGDYDLCENCVNNGKLCPGEDHWLIKRFIREGKVVTSVTERVGRKFQKEALEVKTMPGGITEEPKPAPPTKSLPEPTRTCNSCVVVLSEREFITCKDCEDFDLCITCHTSNAHGHNPKHAFEPAHAETVLPLMARSLLKAGRNVAHNAICDMCDKKIYGIRHKCLDCPDWDVCSACHPRAKAVHPVHRFAAIAEPLAEPRRNAARHFGIYCDGPQCRAQSHQSYIVGDRYKCAVCHDTDFCASCEASPTSSHNRTHPLIKFRTPVRNVSITTTNEDLKGNVRSMGDKKPKSSAPVVSAPVETADREVGAVNTAGAVQTVAEIPPTFEDAMTAHHAVQPKDGDVLASASAPSSPLKAPTPVSSALLTATFVRDTIPDGTLIRPGFTFTQIWTLRNEGPFVWPAGCSVRYVGGDNMLNVDNFRPASVTDLAEATESSVVAREVQIGEEVSFRITLRAPIREGRSISYWRLKAADGTPFGHRLWCDIEVRSRAAPSTQAETVINAPTESAFGSSTVQSSPPEYQHYLKQMQQRQLRLLQEMRQGQIMQAQMRQAQTEAQRSVSTPLPMLFESAPGTTGSEALPHGRVEAARARVEALRTKIMQQRAMQANLASTLTPKVEQLHYASPEGFASDTKPAFIKTEEAQESVEGKLDASSHPPSVKDDAEAELGASSNSSSQMIFPKLEKESPASSVISAAKPAYVQTEAGQVEGTATMHTPEQQDDEQVIPSPAAEEFDDLEVVSAGVISDDDDEDDGFLTDEEYDILDASDSETVASP